MAVFFKPENSWAGDFIPFFWDGEYHLFYLRDWREEGSLAGTPHLTPWHHIGTKDGAHFTDYGEAIPRGTRQDQDMCIYTGDVLEADGQFHIFYTGHNPYVEETGKPKQSVMHATSPDLITWTKDPSVNFYADPDVYERDDWRDPFVFWNEEAQEYWMLLAARLKEGPYGRRGCTALCASTDLTNWEIREPFWSPCLYYTHECPDLFKMGEWWYLIVSEFSDTFVTRYRMSKSLSGPWIAPENDSFDTRAWYAAKTASDGTRRLGFGWNPTRVGEDDEGRWEWGGSLIVHEIVQQSDGSLTVKLPEEVESLFAEEVPLSLKGRIGDWQIDGRSASSDAGDGFSWCAIGDIPESCMISAKVSWDGGTRSLGVIVWGDDNLDSGYQIKLEPHRNRVLFDRFPRPGDQPFVFERPVDLSEGNAELKVLVEDTIIEVYVNDEVPLSTRGYDAKGRGAGLFVSEGSAKFTDVSMVTTP